MTADSQVADQGAVKAIGGELCRWAREAGVCETHKQAAERILSALAEAGYTVVKTEDVRWEYGVGWPVGDERGYVAIRERDRPFSEGQIIDLRYEYGRSLVKVRRRPAGPWVPVPEGSAETRTAQQHVDAALNELPLLMAVERTYYDVVRSMTDDPDVLAAVDKAEAAEGSADRGSEEGGER